MCIYTYAHIYNCNFIDTDYGSPRRSFRFNPGQTTFSYTISTYEDSILETKERSFIISAKYPSQPNNTDDCDITAVTIIDDDGMYIHTYVGIDLCSFLPLTSNNVFVIST